MKTAISVPDDLFDRAELLVRRTGRTRSDVYSAALREYVARHDPDELTERIDRAVAHVGIRRDEDAFLREAARRRLADSQW